MEVEMRNRFKGLDLRDRVSDELWMEVRDFVQETGIKTIVKIKKCKTAKRLSEEAMSKFFTSGGQNIGISASASVLPMNIHIDFLQDCLV